MPFQRSNPTHTWNGFLNSCSGGGPLCIRTVLVRFVWSLGALAEVAGSGRVSRSACGGSRSGDLFWEWHVNPDLARGGWLEEGENDLAGALGLEYSSYYGVSDKL